MPRELWVRVEVDPGAVDEMILTLVRATPGAIVWTAEELGRALRSPNRPAVLSVLGAALDEGEEWSLGPPEE